jgi:hypothetical protein
MQCCADCSPINPCSVRSLSCYAFVLRSMLFATSSHCHSRYTNTEQYSQSNVLNCTLFLLFALHSYHLVDYLFFIGTIGYINDLRVNQMGLEPIRRGENGYALINDNKVPFAKMWSPSLVPKPKDWGPHVSVTVKK